MIFLPVDILATGISKAIGCPLDQGKVLVWLLIHVGCGYGYRKIRGSLNRNLYGMTIGTLFCLSMFGARTLFTYPETLFLYAFLTGIYFVTMQFKKKAAVYVFGGGFLCLSFYHIKRMIESRRLLTQTMVATIWILLSS